MKKQMTLLAMALWAALSCTPKYSGDDDWPDPDNIQKDTTNIPPKDTLDPVDPPKDTVVSNGPSFEIADFQVSHHSVGLALKLLDGKGEKCNLGVKLDGREVEVHKKIKDGETTLFSINCLKQGEDNTLRLFARNSMDTTWMEKSVRLEEAPSAYKVDWTDISGEYSMPDGVKLYKASSGVTGRNVNMWYAIADMSKVALRTTLASTVTTPTDQVQKVLSAEGDVYVTVNGGYFASPSGSYSHLTDKGVRKAKNIATLTRSASYYVTRGAFGVDEKGSPSIYWIFDESSFTAAYTSPLPVVDGGPVLSTSETFPSEQLKWAPYEAVGGAPVLLRDGRICFDYLKTPDGKYYTNCELLQSDIFAEGLRAPRTAVGYTADGSVVLFICDGRDSGGSKGLTLDEEARILLGLGCTDALNLDGGGSTAMVAGNNGTLLNCPSDGSERKVLHFVSFVKK